MTNKERFLEICKTKITRQGIDALLSWLEKSDFFTAPASTKFHGNYEGGLLEHSLNVYDALNTICSVYKQNIPEETIAIVSLFHDLCKTYFYKKELKAQKVDGKWIEKEIYVIDDQIPLGHGEKSVILIQKHMELSLDEALAIRWHMNGYDTAVKGGDRCINEANEISKLVSLLQIADSIASGLLEETR